MRQALSLLLVLAGLGLASEEGSRAAIGEEAGKATLSGKILDAKSAPLAGAKVTPYRLDSTNPRWGRFQVARDVVSTGDDGAYKFEGVEPGYYMVSVEREGLARGLKLVNVEAKGAEAPAEVVMRAPASASIHLKDREGKPVVGARVRELTIRGVNGECRIFQLWMRSLGIEIPPSDEEGRLQLPALPSGDVVKLGIEHSSLAPVRVEGLTLRAGSRADASVTMPPGVVVTLHTPPGSVSKAVIDLRHEPFDDPSTFIYYELDFDREGKARMTVAPGDYSWLLLQEEGHFLTPVYSASHLKKQWLRIAPGRNQDLHFDARRKASAKGRVVDADTGKPLREMSIYGELANATTEGWADRPPGDWSFAGWGESDAEGRFAIDLAAGPARVSFQGNEYLAEKDHYEFKITDDGQAMIPDIKVRRLPKVVGVVRNPDGSPAAKAIVRLRGRYMNGLQPVLTDASGRFEIQSVYLPSDPETGKRLVNQTLVAFDPYRPLAARAEIRLDQPGEAVLTLEPHTPDWPISAFRKDMTDWERGDVEPDRASKGAAVSLKGKTPPEIDASSWINTPGQDFGLAGLKGKYILLDFWFIGCGPCHGDFPSVKLVHELYKDRGVAVIGIHNNSSPPEAVRKHVAEIGLPFPVAVDHPDGRIVARFEDHGLPDGYPDYVLISPEGKVLLDDRTIPHPSLRSYKLEIIRQHWLESQGTPK
ncbi:carboxypeptidase regulatory-like domain-containing protein [Singulisphaera sp. PoT]|uniref:carboxypeptidase regulatory-like domain-containing protein n=1 Tax=Singulisphaera sp. PoT TaxID=3411797 RepID=UPI003BF5495B